MIIKTRIIMIIKRLKCERREGKKKEKSKDCSSLLWGWL